MKRKLLITLLAVASCLACALGLAACDGDGGGNTQHSHSWSQSWERNETHHWHNCTVAGCPVTENSQKDGYAEHDFYNGNCVCGQPKPHTHSWSQSWEINDTHHWHNCTAENCTVTDNSQKDGYAEHDFSNGNCVCGQPKPHTHSWSQSWEINDTHHWHNCTAENCTVTDNSQKDGYAEHDFYNGNCVCGQSKPTDGLAYALNSDGKSYRVTGIGVATDTEISIPALNNGKPVTRISKQAFQNNATISKVVIPDSVTSIGDRAFASCSSLMSIVIPDSVTSIGGSAFNSCGNLTSVTIGNGVTSIGDMAFRFCQKLTNITIPDSVTSIGDDIFEGCSNLNYNEYRDAYYLGNANNPYLILTDTKYKTIYNCNINSNTKFIYSKAFINCNKLSSIAIPDGVTSIGSSAFRNCSELQNISIPDSVTRIGGRAFENMPAYNVFDNVYYLGNTNNPYLILIGVKDKSATNYTINSNTKVIYYEAFKDCSNLTSIVIPDGVTSIDNAFRGCSKLASISIPDSVTSIGGAFMNCSALTNITIPDSVTIINNSTFYNCSALTSITIPDSVTSINDYAFYSCRALTSINFNGTKAEWNDIEKNDSWDTNTGNYTIHCTDGNIAVEN